MSRPAQLYPIEEKSGHSLRTKQRAVKTRENYMREACTERFLSRKYCVKRLVGLTHMCGVPSSWIRVPQETGLVESCR
jgi:hypothetical protein